MNKGMFYLLPFLALTQVASSDPMPQGRVVNLLNVIERVRLETPKKPVILTKPVSGRNINGRRVVKILKPRDGRNASRLKGKLIRR